MNAPEYLQMEEGYACYRPVGHFSLQEVTALISTAIAYSCEHQIRKLFIDSTQVTGIDSLTMIERYNLSEELVRSASSYIKIALLAKPNLIHPRRFAATVARNRGLHLNVSASESEALAWLLEPNTH